MRALRFVLVAALVGLGSSAQAQTLTVKGSDTLVVLVQRWAEAYMAKHPEAKIQVTGGGTGTGFAALINGTTDIATASRRIKPQEVAQLKERSGENARERVVAKDGVTFYVHASNPVSALSMEQLKKLYMGDLTRWNQVGGPDREVALYSRENSSGTYEFVKERLLQKEDFAVVTQTLPGTAAVVNTISLEPYGLGYGGAAYSQGVKELQIKLAEGQTVSPTDENIRTGRYPLSRDLYFYTQGKPSPLAQAFLDFAVSEEGQRWVRKLGYYPIH